MANGSNHGAGTTDRQQADALVDAEAPVTSRWEQADPASEALCGASLGRDPRARGNVYQLAHHLSVQGRQKLANQENVKRLHIRGLPVL